VKFNFSFNNNTISYIAIVCAAFIMTFIINAADFDMWARLAVGSIVFQTGHVLKTDIFSYADVKSLWVDHEWGTGVLFYTLAHFFGDMGLFALKFLLIFSIFLLIAKIIKLSDKNINLDPMMLILLGLSTFPSLIATVRSQLFTYLFFTLWIYLLEKIKRGENKLLWLFPLTMLLWVNLHGGFLAGFGLIAVYIAGDLISKKSIVKYLKILAFTLPVTLINPYGFAFWQYILQAVSMNRPHIFEWQHFNIFGPIITFYGVPAHLFIGFEILFILTVFSLIYSIKNKIYQGPHKLVLLFITLILGLSHQRHIIFFVLTSFSLFYVYHINIIRHFTAIVSDKFGKNFIINIIKTKNALVVLLIMFILSSPMLYNFKILSIPYLYPVGAIEFIVQNDLKGNVFVPYRWGSYALWKLYPQCLVSVDGRYEEVYPDKVFDMAADFSGDIDPDWRLYKDISSPAKNWMEFISTYHTDIIILPKIPINELKIKELKDWKVVYEDYLTYVLLSKKMQDKLYVLPNSSNQVYWHENLGKHVNLK
jgi:hypothetical protein